ncbi:MAG: ketoacyl-ACP synthase III [Gammaproteobacteria bacterium]|jgi:3-oxoacyl-[acyl-carrier-protein] synthase-3|nr:ketoacyl-ACP synthase III [Gammaproteobacteria bacterium]
MKARIAGVGAYLPKRVLTNAELSTFVETSDEWIQERVGIRERRIAEGHETNAFMASEAGKAALLHAGLSAEDLDLIIVTTSTPDHMMPGVACSVQANLGAACPAFDLNAACGGFIYGLHTAKQFFDAGSVRHVLLVGSELMSRILDWTDRSTCVLFGDGAGAVVLSASETPGILASRIFADGMHRDLLYVSPHLRADAFATDCPVPQLKMEGNKVFRVAVEKMGELVDLILKEANCTQDQIDFLVPHQANERIITATAKKLNLSMDKVILTLGLHGNTMSATIPLALADAVHTGKIKRGDLLLFEAFGAGFVWGASLVRY